MNRAIVVAFAVFAALSLAGCTKSVDGQGAYAAALSATAQRERTDIAAPTATVTAAAPSVPSPATVKEVTLAELISAVSRDATRYWAEHGAVFPAPSVSTDFNSMPCAQLEAGSMEICDDIIYYDPTLMEGERRTDGGDIRVAEGVAHEVGHALEHYTGGENVDNNTNEVRADCASGAYTAFRFDITESRAVELFNRTDMYDKGSQPTKAFTTGFETQRDGGDTVSVCTTYTMRGH